MPAGALLRNRLQFRRLPFVLTAPLCADLLCTSQRLPGSLTRIHGPAERLAACPSPATFSGDHTDSPCVHSLKRRNAMFGIRRRIGAGKGVKNRDEFIFLISCPLSSSCFSSSPMREEQCSPFPHRPQWARVLVQLIRGARPFLRSYFPCCPWRQYFSAHQGLWSCASRSSLA